MSVHESSMPPTKWVWFNLASDAHRADSRGFPLCGKYVPHHKSKTMVEDRKPARVCAKCEEVAND